MLYVGKGANKENASSKALKLFLSLLLVFSMIPSGLTMQSFADDTTGDVATSDTENVAEPEVGSDAVSGEDEEVASDTESTEPTVDVMAGTSLPVVRAGSTTIYWSPTQDDITSDDGTVIAKKGSDDNDGSSAENAVLTWSKIQELTKDLYSADVNVFVTNPITPGKATLADSLELNGETAGNGSNITIYPVGIAASSVASVETGKTITFKNIHLDITGSTAQQSISVNAATDTDAGGNVEIGENVTINGRINVALDKDGKSAVTTDGTKSIKNPVKLVGAPFSAGQGSIDVYFTNLNTTEYLNGITVITSDTVDSLKDYMVLDAINGREGFEFKYVGEVANPTSESAWDKKKIQAYKKQEVSQVYLDPAAGDDANDGLTHNKPVKTVAKAKTLLTSAPWIESATTRIITVCSTINISGTETWDFSDVTLPSGVGAEIRMCEQNGADGGHELFKNLIDVAADATFTVKGVTIRINVDADKTNHATRAINVHEGATVTLQTGSKVTGGMGENLETQAPGHGIWVESTGTKTTTLTMERGSEVSYFTRGVYVSGGTDEANKGKTVFNFNGGLITKNSSYTYRVENNSDSYVGGGGVSCRYATMNMGAGATVSNNEMFKRNSLYQDYLCSSYGSGIFLYFSDLTINGGSVIDNVPRDTGLQNTLQERQQNSFGAGIYSFYGNLVLTNATINRNSLENMYHSYYARSYGGGIYYYSSSARTDVFQINGGSISDNNAQFGAAIYADNVFNDSYIKGTENNRVKISGNKATKSYNSNAGAVRISADGFDIEYVDFIENKVDATSQIYSGYTTTGGALYLNLYNNNKKSANVKDCSFTRNGLSYTGNQSTEFQGGAVYAYVPSTSNKDNPGNGCNLTFENCNFDSNFIDVNQTSEARGGAVYVYGGGVSTSVVFKNNNFLNNTAKQGGAIYNQNIGYKSTDASYTWQGACIVDSNNTFTNNKASKTNAGNHIYNSGSLELLGGTFKSQTTEKEPAISYYAIDTSRSLFAKFANLSFEGCSGVYLGNTDSSVTSLDSTVQGTGVLPIATDLVDLPVLKGAQNVGLPNINLDGIETYNVDDAGTQDFINAVSGAIPDDEEFVAFDKTVYLQKKADLSSDGIYLDGVRGDDNNTGLTSATAVKTFAVAKQKLKDKIAEVNAQGKTFNPYIIVSGTVTLSEDATITLSADEIGPQTAKAYDAVPTDYVLPDEDKEFFPMIIPSTNLSGGMFAITAGNVTFDSVYFDGRSKDRGNTIISVNQTGGVTTITGNSRVVNFRKQAITTSGSSSTLNISGNTFVGYNSHYGSNTYSSIYASSGATLNIDGDVYLLKSMPRFTDSTSNDYGYCIGVSASNCKINGNVTIKNNANTTSAYSSINSAGLYVDQISNVTIGDAATDTEDRHVRFAMNDTTGSIGIGMHGSNSSVSVNGYTEFTRSEGLTYRYGYAVACLYSPNQSTISFNDNCSISRLMTGIYFNDYSSCKFDVSFNDNSKIQSATYGIYRQANSANTNAVVNVKLNGNTSISAQYGMYLNANSISMTYGMRFNTEMHGSASIVAEANAYRSMTALGDSFLMDGNSKISATSNPIYLYRNMNGNGSVGTFSFKGNSSVYSTKTSLSSIYYTRNSDARVQGKTNIYVNVEENAVINGSFALQNDFASSSKIAIKDSGRVIKNASQGESAILTDVNLELDMTATVDGKIAPRYSSAITLNDPNSQGTQVGRFTLDLDASKFGSRVIGPGKNVTNAGTYKSTFTTNSGYDLVEGTGTDENWLVLESRGDVFISSNGSDSNTGLSGGQAVKSFSKAKQIMKTQKSGASFILMDTITPASNDLNWELDAGGTITNTNGDTWKPYITVLDSFSYDSSWLKISDLGASAVMKLTNLSFKGLDNKNFSCVLIDQGYGTLDATTTNSRTSKLQIEGCSFEDIKGISDFKLIRSWIETSISNTTINNVNNVSYSQPGSGRVGTSFIRYYDLFSKTLTLDNVTVTNNTITCTAYGNSNTYAATLLYAGNGATVNISNSTFENNTFSRTGTTNMYGGFVEFDDESSANISKTKFLNNKVVRSSGIGGLAYGTVIYGRNVSLLDSEFVNNTEENGNKLGAGGTIYLAGGDCIVENSKIQNNTSGFYANTLVNVSVSGSIISGNGKIFNMLKANKFSKLELSNNTVIEDGFLLDGLNSEITLSSAITNPNITYSFYTNVNPIPGRVLVKPDGTNLVSVEGYLSKFKVADNNSSYGRFELGASDGNLVMIKPIYIGGASASDSNTGYSPNYAVKTFTRAKALAGENGSYANYYISGMYEPTATSETWDLNSAKASTVQRYNGQTVPGSSTTTYQPYKGALINLTSGKTLTFSNITINGAGADGDAVGGILSVASGATATFGTNSNITSATTISQDTHASIVDNSGTVTVNGNAQLYGINAGNVPAIYQAGTLNLAETPRIRGVIELTGSGSGGTDNKVLNAAQGLSGYNKSTFSLKVDGPYSGRNVVVYPTGYEPTATDLANFAFDDATSASYSIGSSETNRNEIILTGKNIAYLDPATGSDNNTGFAPDVAKKTLQGVYDTLNKRAEVSGKGGGIIYLVSRLSISNTVSIRNVPAGTTTPERSYLTSDDGNAQTDGYVQFRRYVRPTRADNLQNYTKATNTGQLLQVTSTGNLSLLNSVNIDGHGKAVDGEDEIAAPAYQQVWTGITSNDSSTVALLGAATIQGSNFNNFSNKNGSSVISNPATNSTVNFNNATINGDVEIVNELKANIVINGLGSVELNNVNVTGNSKYSIELGATDQGDRIKISGTNNIAAPITCYQRINTFNLANTATKNVVDDEEVPFKVEFNSSYTAKRGDVIAKFSSGEAPSTVRAIKEKVLIDDTTRAKFNLVRDTTDTSQMKLDYPGAVYVNGADAGSDDYDGLTADTSVKTLRKAYEKAYDQDAAYIMFVGAANISGGTYTVSQNSFSDGVNDDITLDRDLKYVRYVKPTNTAQGFAAPTFSGTLLKVADDATFNMSNLEIDGHRNAWTGDLPETMVSPAFVSGSTLINSSGTTTLNDGSKLSNNHAVAPMVAGVKAFSGSILNINALDMSYLDTNSSLANRVIQIDKDSTVNINDPDKFVLSAANVTELTPRFAYSEKGAYVTFKKAPSASAKYGVDTLTVDPERDYELAKFDFEGADAENYKSMFTVKKGSSDIPTTLVPDAKYDDSTMLALEDYNDITVTKTWTKPNEYAGEHPDSLQFTIANGNTAADKDTAGDMTVDVSVPSTGDATATHGSVVKSTNAKGEDVWTVTLKDMPRYEGKGRTNTEINYGVKETKLGGEDVDASEWKAEVNKATNQTFTISNTPQRVLTYNGNGNTGGQVIDPAISDYGATVTAAGAGTLVKTAYLFAGWNTVADGSGTHYNTNDTFALTENTTLYAMWARTDVGVITKSASGSQYAKTRRGDTMVFTYRITLPETANKNQMTLVIPADANMDFANATFTGSDFDCDTTTANTWTVTSKNTTTGEKTFTISVPVKTDKTVNNATQIMLNGKATIGSIKDSPVVNGLTVAKSYKVAYDVNTGTGTAPTDDKYYAPEIDTSYQTKTGEGLSKEGFTFAGWNTLATGLGTHQKANAVVQSNTLTDDVTYYAQWTKADVAYTISSSKVKAKPGGTVRFELKYTIPENASSVGNVTLRVKIPEHTTIANPGAGGGVIDTATNTILYTIATSTAKGEIGGMWFSVKIDNNVTQLGIDKITCVGNATYDGDITFVSNTVEVPLADAYQVTYDGNGSTSGTAPTDDGFYAKDLGEKATVKAKGGLAKLGYIFVGWNTTADGLGVHVNSSDELEIDDNTTLYAQWAKMSVKSEIVGVAQGVTKARRGDAIKFSYVVELPESAEKNELEYTITNDTNIDFNSAVFESDDFYCDTTAGNFVVTSTNDSPGTFTFSITATVKTDKSVNSASQIAMPSDARMGDGSISTPNQIALTKSYTVTYDGNGADSGVAPTDSKYYAPEYSDKATVVGNVGEPALTKEGYAFSGWNTAAEGTGTTFAPGGEVDFTGALADDITLHAQWAHASVTSTNELGKDKVRRGETITYTATIDVPAPTTTLGLTITLPDELEYVADSADPTSATVTGKTITWANVTAPKGEFSFKFSAKVSEDATVNDLKSVDIDPEFTNNGNAFDISHAVEVTRSYMAEFDNNGGTGDVYYNPTVKFMSPEYGDVLTLPTDKGADGAVAVTRTGYTFNGFNTAEDGSGTHYDAASTTTLNQDLKAFVEWNSNIYTIAFDKNADEATGTMASISAHYDTAVALPANTFTRDDGWGFIGWGKTAESTENLIADGAEVKNLAEENGAEVTLYAIWSHDFNTIKFDSKGGSAVADMNVPNNETATKPTDPTRKGYAFAGWFTDEGTTTEFSWDTAVTENMTLYAKWTPVTYKVTFNGNGATSGTETEKTLTYDEVFKLDADIFTNSNYTFKEWNTEADGTGTAYKGANATPQQVELLNLADTQDANVTLYAIWNAGTYTIHFDKSENAATGEMADQVVKYDETVKLNENKFAYAGHMFGGWTTTKGDMQAQYADGMSVKQLAQAGGTVTLYAIWTDNYKVVAFDSNGGSAVKSQNVEVGKTAVRPDDPVREGYNFSGWMLGETPYEFTEAVTESITLKAAWTPAEYTIHFDINGGNGGSMGDINANYDESITLPANTFTKTGYTFKGWMLESTGESIADKATVRNLTDQHDTTVVLKAVWEANAYQVKFDANTGEGTMANQSFVYDGAQKLNANAFTKESNVFAGWSKTVNGADPIYGDGATVVNLTDVQGDTVTLYAQWSNNAHTVKFDSNGGTKVSDVNVADGKTVAKPADPKRKGYTFVGWMNGDVAYDFSIPVTADLTLTAKWVANSYKVVFDGNGAVSGTMSAQAMTYNVASALTKNTYTRDGYTFSGWATDPYSSDVAYTDGESVKNLTDEGNATVTLYAVWIAANYEVKFDANTGAGIMANQPMTFDVEAALSANEFTKAGNGFVGWTKNSDGTGDKFIDGAVVKNLTRTNGDIVTLYAQWAEIGGYKIITFNSNGGSTVLPQNVKTGEVTVEPAAPTKAGYTFDGWYDSSDNKFEFGQELTADITLTAKWTANKYTVKFESNGGKGKMDDQVFTFDQAANLNANAFTKAGYTFRGWEATIDGEVVEYADGAEILNLTDKADDVIIFTAEWIANSYTVKFDANTGTGTMADQTFTYDVEQTLTPNAFTKAGNKFAGWNTEANGSGTLYLDGDKVKNIAGENDSETLYATWVVERNAILIEFDTGDGASEQLPQYVERGSKLKQAADPTKLGYTFIGWYNGETAYDFDTPVTAPLKLTAKWVANTYTVNFAGSDEDDGVMEPMTFTYDVPRKLEKNTYTKENYHFLGWRLIGGSATIVTFAADEPEEELIADEAEVMNLTPEQNGQVSLEAVWAADSFNITYRNVEGATNNNPLTYTYGEGVEELQNAYKADETFEGWYTTADFSGAPVTSISKEQTGDITLYAKWTENGSDNPFGPGGNPLTPSWISKLLAGTGDVMPYVASALALLVAMIGGLTFVSIRRRKASDTAKIHGAHVG